MAIVQADRLELVNELFDQLDISYEEYYRAVYQGVDIFRADMILSQTTAIERLQQIADIVKELINLMV